jgi:receptor tyrosine kinase-like orphan receptor 1
MFPLFVTDAASSGLMYIIGPVIAVICAIVLVMIIICLCQRRKKKRNGTNKQAVAGATPTPMEMNPMLKAPAPNKAKEFPISSIRFVQDLGEGTYGNVFRGELVGCYGDNSLTPIMIKTLKEMSPVKTQQEFHLEIETITDFKHPNVVTMLGVCLSQRPQCMLFEYLAHGDLHEYLTMHSPHSDISVSDDEGTVHILQHTDMIHIATQVAAGLEYLGLHQFVHKDIAARNIVVGDSLNIKIANFGISRTVYSTDYYRLQNQCQLPIRWMSSEAILYSKFTVESDIWSFGVVLWEIYSYGLQPYYGYANTEVVEMIRGRQILPCPEECPARIYALMVETWHEVPTRRPCFKEIHQRLCQWQKEAHVMAAHHGNPHLAINMAHSASVHSSSTRTSSHPSHHSSMGGPSNNTTTTGVTGSSAPSHVPPHNYGAQPHMNYNQLGRPPPHYGQVMGQQQQQIPNIPYSQRPNPNAQQGLYKKPSPPGSVSSHSHKSSSLPSDSPASSVTNFKGPGNAGQYSPTKAKSPLSLAHNKDLFIPETRASDI